MKLILFLLFSISTFSANLPDRFRLDPIAVQLSNNIPKSKLYRFKKAVLSKGSLAMPALTHAMRSKKFPIENRWISTFLVGQVMGKKGIPFLAKFTKHPNWMMRLASLKTLTLLGAKDENLYIDLLKDKSMIVRFEVLETARKLKLKKLAPKVWNMIFDKRNYIVNKGLTKRSELIKKAIRTIGDLEYNPARKSLLKMSKSKRYQDIKSDLSYSLSHLSTI